jgi:hypothetical protein
MDLFDIIVIKYFKWFFYQGHKLSKLKVFKLLIIYKT